MRKIFVTFIAFLICICGFSSAIAAQNAKPKKIFMVMLYPEETMVEKAFKEYFSLKKHNVVFSGESVFNDKKNVPKVLERIKQEKPDLVYIYGTLPTLGMVGTYDTFNEISHITDIPVVFAGLAEPVKSKVVKQWGASGRNVTGLGLLVPTDTQLATMNLYMPFKKIAVIYNPSESQSNLVVDNIKKIGKASGFEVVDAPIKLKDGKPDVKSIPAVVEEVGKSNVDMVYFPSDAFIVNNIQDITKRLNDLKIPTFGYNEFMVTKPDTVLFGVFCSLYTLGQKAAVKAVDILFNGVDVSKVPVEIATPYSVIFRKDTLEKVKKAPKLEFLEIAQGIGNG